MYPALFEVNTRILLSRIGTGLGRRPTLDDVPDSELDRLAGLGFQWVWLLGVWQTGPEARRIARVAPEVQQSYRDALEDFRENDVRGSPFAVQAYRVHADFGGDEALRRVRERLARRGLRLLLDFVPNHTAIDHEWATTHPEYYVQGTDEQLARQPLNYRRLGSRVFAHGRDPYFPGWTDTFQLNYAGRDAQMAIDRELARVSDLCDGVRCDMAMLVLPDVFERTWGVRPPPFWPQAIAQVKRRHPEFVFLAEVYWDLEWELQRQGFDYTYDKRLYDRLRAGAAGPVREHLRAELEFQRRSVRFLENHDEPRAAAVFTAGQHRAAAVIAYCCPGMRFFHDGQFEGRRKRIPVQLGRGPRETVDPALRDFYMRLLSELPQGEWKLLEPAAAWDGNRTWENFIAYAWTGGERQWLIAVNYADTQGQCYVYPPFPRSVRLTDVFGGASYDRDGGRVYIDLPPWGYHVFEVRPAVAG